MEEVKYNELQRYGSWGTANLKKKELEETYGKGKVFIFKNQSHSPFTAFSEDCYVVMVLEQRR